MKARKEPCVIGREEEELVCGGGSHWRRKFDA